MHSISFWNFHEDSDQYIRVVFKSYDYDEPNNIFINYYEEENNSTRYRGDNGELFIYRNYYIRLGKDL
jgi:hypothetical protein